MFRRFALSLVCLFLPFAALAQVPEVAGPGIGSQIGTVFLGLLQNEAVLGLIVAGLVFLYRQWRGDKAAKELQAFDLAVKLAYDGTTNYAALYPGEKVNKAAKGLELFSRALKTELGRGPTPAEVESAQLHFDAIHGTELAAKGLAAVPAPVP